MTKCHACPENCDHCSLVTKFGITFTSCDACSEHYAITNVLFNNDKRFVQRVCDEYLCAEEEYYDDELE